jgi:FkbM family methyltransferase
VDIGANIGLYTALAVRHVGSTGRVVAVEADRESFKYLRQTVAANNATNVTCIPKAAADHCGVMKLFVSKDNRGDNRLYDNELCSDSYDVEVVTMDALLAELGISSVDVVKIDVQGYEGHVLEGMRQTLARSPNVTIFMEFWPHGLRCARTQPDELLSDLEKMGFVVCELKSNGSLARVRDFRGLIGRYTGRKYTSVVAMKNPDHKN